MSVVSVELAPEAWEGSWNRLWQRNYTVAWRVETDSRRTGPYLIRAAVDGATPPKPLVPRIGNSYYISPTEKDVGSFATEVTTKFVAFNELGGCEWLVTIAYTPYDASKFPSDPTLWGMLLSYGSSKYERVVQVDQAGAPILNSASDPFTDPVTIDDNRSVYTVERNELVAYTAGPPAAGFNPDLAELYRDKVNDATWNGFDEKTVKCSSITTGKQQYDSNNNVYYYGVTYVFEVNRDTWKKSLLDQGFNQVVSGARKPILLGGQKIEEAALLDGSGGLLAIGGTPVFLDSDVYPAVDFSVFNIDFSLALGR